MNTTRLNLTSMQGIHRPLKLTLLSGLCALCVACSYVPSFPYKADVAQGQGIDTPKYKLTVYFNGDVLDKIDGSNMPTEQEFVDTLSGSKATSKPEMTEQELKAAEGTQK